MLYTVKPLESIYAPPGMFDPRRKGKVEGMQAGKQDGKQEGTAESEYKEMVLPNGRIVTRREGDNYIIERINSTDMKDYLNDQYVPGKNYQANDK